MARKQTRKSRAQRREEARQQRARFWMGTFTIGIMLLSVVSFAFVLYGMGGLNSGEGTQGLDNFRIDNDRLLASTPQGEVPFYSWPDSEAPLPQEARESLQQAQSVIITFDPQQEDDLAFLDLVRWEFSQYLPIPIQTGVLTESDDYPYEIITCEQATPQTPVIQFVPGTDGTSYEDSCITVSAVGEIIVLQRDQMLYAYYDLP